MRCVYATRALQRAGWRPWYLADGRSCPGIHRTDVLLPSRHLVVRSSWLRDDVYDICSERFAKLCEEYRFESTVVAVCRRQNLCASDAHIRLTTRSPTWLVLGCYGDVSEASLRFRRAGRWRLEETRDSSVYAWGCAADGAPRHSGSRAEQTARSRDGRRRSGWERGATRGTREREMHVTACAYFRTRHVAISPVKLCRFRSMHSLPTPRTPRYAMEPGLPARSSVLLQKPVPVPGPSLFERCLYRHHPGHWLQSDGVRAKPADAEATQRPS